MWEDVTVALACLGFAAALALIVAEVRGLIAEADPFEHAPVEHARMRSMGAEADPAAARRHSSTAATASTPATVGTAGAADHRGSRP